MGDASGARRLRSEIPSAFVSGFALHVPLMDTTTYLDYLEQRFRDAGGEIQPNKCFTKLEESILNSISLSIALESARGLWSKTSILNRIAARSQSCRKSNSLRGRLR